ncbi:hypothetical protein EG329_001358 [Mollisiaceae sp. DMI_Dod_QoI]|nr:hypothetical protein EG329_001358 [Helotiales sp. DMI_Dod_QoI]
MSSYMMMGPSDFRQPLQLTPNPSISKITSSSPQIDPEQELERSSPPCFSCGSLKCCLKNKFVLPSRNKNGGNIEESKTVNEKQDEFNEEEGGEDEDAHLRGGGQEEEEEVEDEPEPEVEEVEDVDDYGRRWVV